MQFNHTHKSSFLKLHQMLLEYFPNESVIPTSYTFRRFLTVHFHNPSHTSNEARESRIQQMNRGALQTRSSKMSSDRWSAYDNNCYVVTSSVAWSGRSR